VECHGMEMWDAMQQWMVTLENGQQTIRMFKTVQNVKLELKRTGVAIIWLVRDVEINGAGYAEEGITEAIMTGGIRSDAKAHSSIIGAHAVYSYWLSWISYSFL
jgi:hypothetical protein